MLFAFGTAYVYGDQIINDRIAIDDTTLPEITADDLFGYQVEAIGDLDGDGIIDLAEISFEYDDVYTQDVGDSDDSDAYGLIKILFMNNDGTVKSTADITVDDTANTGLGRSCLDDPTRGGVGDDILGRDDRILEQLAFIGDLDDDGRPTIAIGTSEADFKGDASKTGGIYMVELNSDGTVNNCLRIVEDENGFDPDTDFYRQETTGAFFGFPLLATDLNGDGKNELIAAATSDDDNSSDLWVLFLNTDGSVASHSATPILFRTDLGGTGYLDDGATVDGENKIVVGEAGTNNVFIVNLNTDGTFSSSTTISGVTEVGSSVNDNFGAGVSPVGDLDGDRIEDILVGAIFTEDNGIGGGNNEGHAYIIYLNSDDTVKETQEISNTTENTRTGSTFLSANDFFGHGMTLWKTEGGVATIAISAIQSDTGHTNAGAIYLFDVVDANPSNGRGGCQGDCIAPTIGLDYTGKRIVDDGFSYNDNAVNVVDGHTEFPLITTLVGITNTASVKVFDNQGIDGLRLVQFGLGIPEQRSPMSLAEVIVEIWIEYGGDKIEDIFVTDSEELIDLSSITVGTSIVSCSDTGLEECVQVSLSYKFNEAPIYNIMRVEVWDVHSNIQISTFNDGLQVEGDSLNPADTATTHVPSAHYPQKAGLIQLTNIDRGEQLWVDPYGFIWQGDDSKMVLVSDIPYDLYDDDAKSKFFGYNDRLNSHFVDIWQEQLDKATILFDSSLIQNNIDERTE